MSKRSVKDKAQAFIARFLACTEGWAKDNPNWDWVELVARIAQADLQRKIASASLVDLGRSSSCPPLLEAPGAVPGNSLKRRKGWLERAADRHASESAPAAAAVSEADVFPLLPAAIAPRNAAGCLQEIELKNKQLGIPST